MDKKINSSTTAGIIAGTVVILGIIGYMTFRRSGVPEKLTPGQEVQSRVMKMSPEEQRKFGEQVFAGQAQNNNGAP